MVSAFGIILLSLSIMGFGFSYSHALKAEKESIEGLIALCERISTRIRCFRQDVSEIYDGFSYPFLNSVGFTFLLKEKGLAEALDACADKLCISTDVMNESRRFAKELGKSYYDEQLTLCNNYLTFLKDKHTEITAGLPSRTKLAFSLSCAISLLSAILFI